MQNRLIEALIAKARRVKRTKDVREVSYGLADLSTKKQLHERMVDKGAVKSLLKLMQCQTHEAQRFAALALGNISSSPETKKTMIDQDVGDRNRAGINERISGDTALVLQLDDGIEG